MEKENSVRIHRVGTITTGLSMIVFGVLFLLHSFLHILSYDMIFDLWPVMLISLGMELLISSFKKKKFIYDKASIVLLMVMTLFVMGMAIADICFTHIPLDTTYYSILSF